MSTQAVATALVVGPALLLCAAFLTYEVVAAILSRQEAR